MSLDLSDLPNVDPAGLRLPDSEPDTRDVAPYLVDRCSERPESAEQLSKRMNQRSL